MGPLKGIKIIELAGLGPAPFCSMLLADMGADIIRVVSPIQTKMPWDDYDILNRGRKSVVLDLKDPTDLESLYSLIEKADGLIEGFRPGVMERLGLSPEKCFTYNPKLVFGRMTGWGQNGPLSQSAGHDINYIALTGALHAIGTPQSGPVPPLNLVGDFGGGGMYLAFGMVCALLEAQKSEEGQVVDAAMVDGAAHLMTMFYGLQHLDMWSEKRGSNILDGGAHFYGTYQCSDKKWISIGSIEPQFYQLLMETVGLDPEVFSPQLKMQKWPELRQILAIRIREKTQHEWCELMEGTDICFAPVLTMNEAPFHPHNRVRKTFVNFDDVLQPAPAPRFSRTTPELSISPNHPPIKIEEAFENWGISLPSIQHKEVS